MKKKAVILTVAVLLVIGFIVGIGVAENDIAYAKRNEQGEHIELTEKYNKPDGKNTKTTISGSKKIYVNSDKHYYEQSDNLLYPQLHKANKPDREEFGKYYEYALEAYNYAVDGEPMESMYFENQNEMEMFQSKIREQVLQDTGVDLLKNFHCSRVISHDRKCLLIPANFGYESFKELQEVENFVVNTFGNQGCTDLELIETVNKWLINNTKYDNEKRDLRYENLGVVRNKSAVCKGYAEFIKNVCDLYHVPCEYITGFVNDGRHAWNRVKIGETWYYIDSTWNVCLKTNEYFLSKVLWSDHKLK